MVYVSFKGLLGFLNAKSKYKLPAFPSSEAMVPDQERPRHCGKLKMI